MHLKDVVSFIKFFLLLALTFTVFSKSIERTERLWITLVTAMNLSVEFQTTVLTCLNTLPVQRRLWLIFSMYALWQPDSILWRKCYCESLRALVLGKWQWSFSLPWDTYSQKPAIIPRGSHSISWRGSQGEEPWSLVHSSHWASNQRPMSTRQSLNEPSGIPSFGPSCTLPSDATYRKHKLSSLNHLQIRHPQKINGIVLSSH